ncbi:MAG: TonB family protein [Myxococcales bacterium]|nr:TonB family protein [Myxococcales bacterium]
MSSKAHASQRARGARGKRLGFWALIALALHLEAGVALLLFSYFFAPREADLEAARKGAEGESVEIGMLDEDAAREILAELERAEEARQEEETKKEVEAKKAPGQVVELPKPRNQERPKDAKFAAEYDSTVAKETKKFGELKADSRMSADGQAAETTTASPPSEAQPQVAPQAGTKAAALAMRTPGPQGADARAQRQGLGPRNLTGPNPETEAGPPDGDGREQSTERTLPEQPLGGGTPGRAGQYGAPSLLPSLDQVAHAIGSGTQDHLDDVDDGAETALNAKKWKFASFFNRVKRQVRDHWRPAEEYRKRDPTFRIYGMRDRFTLLKVELKSDGSLASVGLDTPSGIDFLDDVAVEAFKQAQPFPNPPRQLVEEGSGLITFRFGFYFEIGGGGASPRMKVFRYNDY